MADAPARDRQAPEANCQIVPCLAGKRAWRRIDDCRNDRQQRFDIAGPVEPFGAQQFGGAASGGADHDPALVERFDHGAGQALLETGLQIDVDLAQPPGDGVAGRQGADEPHLVLQAQGIAQLEQGGGVAFAHDLIAPAERRAFPFQLVQGAHGDVDALQSRVQRPDRPEPDGVGKAVKYAGGGDRRQFHVGRDIFQATGGIALLEKGARHIAGNRCVADDAPVAPGEEWGVEAGDLRTMVP